VKLLRYSCCDSCSSWRTPRVAKSLVASMTSFFAGPEDRDCGFGRTFLLSHHSLHLTHCTNTSTRHTLFKPTLFEDSYGRRREVYIDTTFAFVCLTYTTKIWALSTSQDGAVLARIGVFRLAVCISTNNIASAFNFPTAEFGCFQGHSTGSADGRLLDMLQDSFVRHGCHGFTISSEKNLGHIERASFQAR
jgi:hypothetical protein